jgi:flagellar basal body rod protein FlgG
MSSGIYSALSGAKARMEMLDTISDNLSNFKTAGFKKGQAIFETMLQEAGSGPKAAGVVFTELKGGFTDFGQGPLIRTGVPLHLGIEGEGFFKIRDQAGNFLYTRQGSFRRDFENNLVTGSGLAVVDEAGKPINLPGSDFEIDEQGNVTLESGEVKRIPLFTFGDNSRMVRLGTGSFSPAAGEQDRLVEKSKIYQGQLEESNVKIMEEMGRMMEATRAFEASQKMLKTFDSLAAQADELGSVG